MTPWHRGRMLAYDCETTGTNPEEARIVSAAAALVGGGEPTRTLSWLIAPDVPIPPEAEAVHGISDERARAEGADPAAAIPAIAQVVAQAVADGLPLVAYVAPFDLTILDRECRRHGVELPDWTQALVVDPFVLGKHLDRYRRGSRKLAATCEHYGATLDGAHDAGHDAIAAARLAWVMAERGQVQRRVRDAAEGRERAALRREWERVRHDLPALHAAQVGWAREQAIGLRDYFEAKGQHEDAASVREDWPLIPALTRV